MFHVKHVVINYYLIMITNVFIRDSRFLVKV